MEIRKGTVDGLEGGMTPIDVEMTQEGIITRDMIVEEV